MKYLRKLKDVFMPWIPLAVAITLLSGLTYGVGQQILRMSANDPQVQYAQDLVNELQNGQTAEAISDEQKIDVAKSLSPFVVVYDETGAPVKSTVVLDGVNPQLPSGVIDYVKNHGTDTFTWQPKKDVRIGAYAMKYDKGVVLVGRSLREVEKRDLRLLKLVSLGWLGTLALTWFAVLLTRVPLSKIKSSFKGLRGLKLKKK